MRWILALIAMLAVSVRGQVVDSAMILKGNVNIAEKVLVNMGHSVSEYTTHKAQNVFLRELATAKADLALTKKEYYEYQAIHAITDEDRATHRIEAWKAKREYDQAMLHYYDATDSEKFQVEHQVQKIEMPRG